MVLGDLQEQTRRRTARRGTGARPSPSPRTRCTRRAESGGHPPTLGRFFHAHPAQRTCATRGAALFKRPLLTGTVALTLAMGLGANAAIFNFDRPPGPPAVCRSPIPIRSSCCRKPGPASTIARKPVSPANFLDWRAQRRRDRPPVGAGLVGRQPARRQRPGADPGIARDRRLLRGAGRAAGARTRVRARRRDLGPPSRRRPQRRDLEAPLRRATRRSSGGPSRSTASPTR